MEWGYDDDSSGSSEYLDYEETCVTPSSSFDVLPMYSPLKSTCRRKIVLTRHGQSMFNLDERIGGNSELSTKGMTYSKVFGDWVKDYIKKNMRGNTVLWTSTLKRTQMTASDLFKDFPTTHRACLDELNAGQRDGLTYKEIQKQFPEEYRDRSERKFVFRLFFVYVSLIDILVVNRTLM